MFPKEIKEHITLTPSHPQIRMLYSGVTGIDAVI